MLKGAFLTQAVMKDAFLAWSSAEAARPSRPRTCWLAVKPRSAERQSATSRALSARALASASSARPAGCSTRARLAAVVVVKVMDTSGLEGAL